jgi:hypothetical protein
MIDGASNKDVQPTTIKAASQLENEYFYPEANGYQAITIRAATRQDAHAIYLERRKPVSPEKVEEQTNNE